MAEHVEKISFRHCKAYCFNIFKPHYFYIYFGSSFTSYLFSQFPDLDECIDQLTNPCMNGGQCVDEDFTFSCNCAPGFEGTRCENDIDECASNPCQNGANCANEVDQYTCNCAPGWRGLTCNIGMYNG